MGKIPLKITGRQKRHRRLRKKVQGTPERPRLCVHKSHKHMYAQIVDDTKGAVVVSVSTLTPEVRDQVKARGGNVAAAALLGDNVAARALEKGVRQIVFDRAGYRYHGRVKALADAARKKGLVF